MIICLIDSEKIFSINESFKILSRIYANDIFYADIKNWGGVDVREIAN